MVLLGIETPIGLPVFWSFFILGFFVADDISLLTEDLRGTLLPIDDIRLIADVDDDDPADPGLTGLEGDVAGRRVLHGSILFFVLIPGGVLENESPVAALPVLERMFLFVEDLVGCVLIGVEVTKEDAEVVGAVLRGPPAPVTFFAFPDDTLMLELVSLDASLDFLSDSSNNLVSILSICSIFCNWFFRLPVLPLIMLDNSLLSSKPSLLKNALSHEKLLRILEVIFSGSVCLLSCAMSTILLVSTVNRLLTQ